jgi:NAD(P)-dependent dehydrogenase (short-subunit alcohol dehydrogenase family)
MASPNPTTLVTGAAGALGACVVRALADAGHRVAAIDHAADRLAAIAPVPGRVLPLAFDAALADGWVEPLARVGAELGPPTGLVLCAGGWAGGTPVAEAGEAVWRRMLALNLETAQKALAAVLPGMIARRQGSVVVIGSRAVERPWESRGAAAYEAAKSALVSYAQAAAAEGIEHGVRINAVLPSTLDTPQNRAAMPGADPAGWVSLERLARVIAFLLSDDAADITGAALPVYGRI